MSQPVQLREIRHTDLVFPQQANHQGSYFGGAALAEMDKIAFLISARHARRPFVTASCDKIDFRICKTKAKYPKLKVKECEKIGANDTTSSEKGSSRCRFDVAVGILSLFPVLLARKHLLDSQE